MLREVPSLKLLHELHLLQASPSGCRFSQLMVLARMRAHVVLPTPRGPQNKNACARCPVRMAFLSVVVMCCWPTSVSKVWGRYLRAETMNLSMKNRFGRQQSRQNKCTDSAVC